MVTSSAARTRDSRSDAMWRASRSSSTSWKSSPEAGHVRPAQDLHRLGRARRRDGLPVLIEHRADLAVGRAADERVADPQRALVHQDRRDRTAALVQVRLDDRARARDRWDRPSAPARSATTRSVSSSVSEVRPRLRRDVDELVLAAPLRRHDPALDHLRAHPVRVGLFLVDLVHRHDDGHAAPPSRGRAPRASAASRRRRRRRRGRRCR